MIGSVICSHVNFSLSLSYSFQEGYGVVVLNTNLNHALVGGRLVSVKVSYQFHINYNYLPQKAKVLVTF